MLILFVFVLSTVYAQQHATSNTHCQMTIEEILREQSFHIDHPLVEEASVIFSEMYEELNVIYTTDLNDPQLNVYIDNFKETLYEAATLNLNITMFDEDIEHVNSITQ